MPIFDKDRTWFEFKNSLLDGFKNIELYNNKGIVKQKGNTLLLNLPDKEPIIAMNEMESDGLYKLIITTKSGKFMYTLNLQGA